MVKWKERKKKLGALLNHHMAVKIALYYTFLVFQYERERQRQKETEGEKKESEKARTVSKRETFIILKPVLFLVFVTCSQM